jgi:DNA repair protein RadC
MSSAQASTQVNFREIEISYGRKRRQPTVRRASDVAKFLRSIVPNNSQEHFIAVYLGAAHDPIGYAVVSSGLLSSCPVHPREVYQRAVLLGAYSVIVAHNHPSDSHEPSQADKDVTKELAAAGKVLGIKILDHIIFTDFSHYSFQEHGLL